MRSIGCAVLVLGLAACDGSLGVSDAGGGRGGDETTSATTVASTTTGSGGDATGGAGGEGGSPDGGMGGMGGMGGFPWDDAIDPNGGPSSDRLTPHELGSTEAGQGFYEYLPSGYAGSNVDWPLLVALHGIGENGNGESELPKVLAAGIAKLINQDDWPVERPFVVLMPQHPGGGCPGAAEIQTFIDYGITHYDIDPRYVYLTGLSCGAIGGWGYLAQNLDSQIAAYVPVAGNGTYAWDTAGCDLAKVGIWAFHGTEDNIVYPSGTHYPMDHLAMCPSPPALETKKTIYPDVFHNSWDMTYSLSAGHDIYSWLLTFTRDP